ncbi:MAG: carbohydrate binding family 9 domain-containing protein [Fimbriimonadaceae bacterium]|nr:carbohydrate binding family 9 domain-containing protein [Chitinophagales bacterium]
MNRLNLITLLLFIIGSTNILAQQLPYEPLRIVSNITLDGKLDEPEWYQTPVETEFMQTDPNPGAVPTQKTEVRILYNDDYLFVAVTCFDTEPDKLIRVNLERDFPLGDEDGTAFIIDTYHDKITALNFVGNTLDARWDAQVTQDGGGLSDSYNTFWDVKTFVGSFGYSTEYRIPFSSLRFSAKEEVLMGFRIARLIKRNNELITFPVCDPNTSSAWTNVSFAREIIFRNLKSRNPLYISPYIIANYSEENILNTVGTAYEKNTTFMQEKNFVKNETLDKIISNIGVDAKYGITKNLTLDLTLNTDFAQAEVDDRIINLTKYEVNLPEKRSFFLESANYLSFGFPSGNEIFISREIGNENGVIVPIIGGVRLTGKVGDWQLGALNMQTTGIEEEGISPHNFSVFRTRKEFDSLGSFVGGIFTNRLNTDTTNISNQSLGIDFVKRINQQIAFEGGVVSTFENYRAEGAFNNMLFHMGLFRSANTGFLYSTTIDLVGEDINPVMGYLDDEGYGELYAETGYQIELEDENSSIQYISLFFENSYRWRTENGNRETFSSELRPALLFNNGAEISFTLFEYDIDSLDENWFIDDENAIAAGTYKTFTNTLTLVAPEESKLSAELIASYGGFYSGKRFFISPFVNYYFNNHLNASLTYEFNHINFDTYLYDTTFTLFTSNLIRLNVQYNFNIKYSLKMYVQFDDLSNQLSSNMRFRYNPTEGTDLFIVFNQGINNNRARLDPHLPVINNQAFTVKFIKTFGE